MIRALSLQRLVEDRTKFFLDSVLQPAANRLADVDGGCRLRECSVNRRGQHDPLVLAGITIEIAAGLLRGKFTLQELHDEALKDEAILSLAAKVDYAIDPDTTFPRHYGGEVVVRLADGRELRRREAVNRGSADRPLSNDDIVAKFMENGTYGLSEEKAVRIRKAILETAEAAPARELAEALGER